MWKKLGWIILFIFAASYAYFAARLISVKYNSVEIDNASVERISIALDTIQREIDEIKTLIRK